MSSRPSSTVADPENGKQDLHRVLLATPGSLTPIVGRLTGHHAFNNPPFRPLEALDLEPFRLQVLKRLAQQMVGLETHREGIE
jgi:hypothetical protein